MSGNAEEKQIKQVIFLHWGSRALAARPYDTQKWIINTAHTWGKSHLSSKGQPEAVKSYYLLAIIIEIPMVKFAMPMAQSNAISIRRI